jgi:phosphoenolpyruvate carboxykinase (GTP)
MRELISIDVEHWITENEQFGDYLDTFGERVPEALRAEQQRIAAELKTAS